MSKLIAWLLKPTRTVYAIFMGIAALVGLAAVFRPEWFSEIKPDVKLEIVANAPVFNLSQPVGKLTVFYDGKSLSGLGASIRSISMRFVNDGRAAVKIGDYDERAPLSILFDGGVLLERPVIQTSSTYLQGAVHIVAFAADKLSFGPVILEPSESFAITALVLVDGGRQVVIRGSGKIAGQQSMSTMDRFEESSKPSFWSEVYGGGYSVQSVRAVSYPFILVLGMMGVLLALFLMLVVIGAPTDFLDGRKEKQDRDRRLEVANRYLQDKKLTYDPVREFVLGEYVFQNRRGSSLYDLLLDLCTGKLKPEDVLRRPGVFLGETRFKLEEVGAYEPAPFHLRKRLKELGDELEKTLERALDEVRALVAYLKAIGVPERDERKSRWLLDGVLFPPRRSKLQYHWAIANLPAA